MPSIARRLDRRTYFLDTSTFSYALRGLRPELRRDGDPPEFVELPRIVERIAASANLCLTSMPSYHLGRRYSAHWIEVAARKMAGSDGARRERASFYDYCHMPLVALTVTCSPAMLGRRSVSTVRAKSSGRAAPLVYARAFVDALAAE